MSDNYLEITYQHVINQTILKESYKIVERRVKLNGKTLFHCKILIVFADNFELIKYWK